MRFGWIILLTVLSSVGVCQLRSVEAIPRSQSRVALFWINDPGRPASGFTVYLDDHAVAQLPPEATLHHFDGLQPGEARSFGVQATYADGEKSPLVARTDRAYARLPDRSNYDVLVIGGTSAGVGAAITAARLGLKVCFIEETNRLGGMIVNGVAVTDVRNPARISGLFAEFRDRVKAYYGGNETGLRYEPWVANMIIKQMVYEEANIDLFFGVRATRALKRGAAVIGAEAVTLADGRKSRIDAEMTIDATIEADYSASAGVKYRVGREPRTLEEPHAGVIYYDRSTDTRLPGSTGQGDRRLQAYAMMLCVKDYGRPVGPTEPPPGYDPRKYRQAPAWDQSWNATSGRLMLNKFEINQHPHGSDLQEVNYNWPWASPEERARIYEIYKNHVLGYLHYIRTVQGKPTIWLADDEYRDNDGFPPTLYVREARRIVGITDFNQLDVMQARQRPHPDSVAVGDYAMDSHAVRVKDDEDLRHMGEGEFWIFQYTPWYQAPYGAIVPKGVSNLLVPSAVSATHVAYGTLRMEPVRMTLGQAAGIAAYLYKTTGRQPAELDPAEVQRILTRFGVYLTFFTDVAASTRHFDAIQFLGARAYFPEDAFNPEAPLTRQEAARLLWLQIKTLRPNIESDPYYASSYFDVTIYHPQMGDLANLTRLGVTPLPANRRFRPAENTSRADWVLWLANMMDVLSPGWRQPDAPNPYEDGDKHATQLHRLGVGSLLWDGADAMGRSGLQLRPDDPISRADAAASLYWLYLRAGQEAKKQ